LAPSVPFSFASLSNYLAPHLSTDLAQIYDSLLYLISFSLSLLPSSNFSTSMYFGCQLHRIFGLPNCHSTLSCILIHILGGKIHIFPFIFREWEWEWVRKKCNLLFEEKKICFFSHSFNFKIDLRTCIYKQMRWKFAHKL
jgi:hypothetical protein